MNLDDSKNLCRFSVSEEGLGLRIGMGHEREGIYAAGLENKQ